MDGELPQPPSKREVHGEMPCMFSCCRNDDSLEDLDDNYSSTTDKNLEDTVKNIQKREIGTAKDFNLHIKLRIREIGPAKDFDPALRQMQSLTSNFKKIALNKITNKE